jgi:branched-chain amino acid transport system permease protein
VPNLSPRNKWIAFALMAILLLTLPFITDELLGRGWVRILDFALLFIMLALGLNIVVGYAGLLDLGYVAFFAVGAYTYALLASPQLGLHLPFWIILPIGALIAGIFGALLGTPTLKLRGDYLAIVTLGFGEIIRIFLNNLNAPVNITNGAQGISQIDPIRIADFSLGRVHEIFGLTFPAVHLHYYLFLVLTLLVIFVSSRLQDSRIGRAWMAIREDEVAAEAMGINTRNIKLLAFVPGLCQPGKFQPDGVGDDPVHGGAWRHGQHRRRDTRWRLAGGAAGSPAQRRRSCAAVAVGPDGY